MFKVGGLWVSPVEVESVLLTPCGVGMCGGRVARRPGHDEAESFYSLRLTTTQATSCCATCFNTVAHSWLPINAHAGLIL